MATTEGALLPSPDQPVGSYLRDLRKAAGLSQAELSRRSGVARPNIAAIEAGTRNVSPEMTLRLVDVIRPRHPELELTPPVLINLELARVALFSIVADPEGARRKLERRLETMRAHDDGGASSWLEDWADLLGRWNLVEVFSLLLSSRPEDVERRKVSPIDAVVSTEERDGAVQRARQVWRATRRVS